MAINTLKGVKEIDGHKVAHVFNDNDCRDLDEIFKKSEVVIGHDENMLIFKMMTKPASEGGSGCQFTTLIETSLVMIKYLDNKFPCIENSVTIAKLESALKWQKTRSEDRLDRGVEGFDKA